ncbi:MAG: molecular chaperone TorD family protein [Rhodoferax sp.]|nr:molecular chaperone TorD family protein [Rhodoferax sp.]
MSDYDPDHATATADLCRFLSACFYEPAQEFAEEKLFDNIVVAASRVSPDLVDLANQLRSAFVEHDIQTLLVDYTRLFVGPMEALAKPYGSSWLPASAPTEDLELPTVLELYSEGGFEIDADFMELPDHVAVELEFLYLLLFKKNQAAAAMNQDALASIKELQQRFLSQHLGLWIGPFGAAVQQGAQTAFYPQLAKLTALFVQAQRFPPSRE